MKVTTPAIAVGLTLALMALAPVAATEADGASVTPAPAAVDIDLKDVTVSEAVAALFKGSGRKYRLEPGVTGTVAEVRLKGIPFADAIAALSKAAGLVYKIEDNTYVISPGPTSAAPVGAGPATAPTAAVAAAEQPPAIEPAPVTDIGSPDATPQEGDPGTTNTVVGPIFYGHPDTDLPPPYYYPGILQFGNVNVISRTAPLLVAPGGVLVAPGGYVVTPPRVHPTQRLPRNPALNRPRPGFIY